MLIFSISYGICFSSSWIHTFWQYGHHEAWSRYSFTRTGAVLPKVRFNACALAGPYTAILFSILNKTFLGYFYPNKICFLVPSLINFRVELADTSAKAATLSLELHPYRCSAAEGSFQRLRAGRSLHSGFVFKIS